MKDFGYTCAAGWCEDDRGAPARSAGPLGGCPPGWYLISHVLDGMAPVCPACEPVEFDLGSFRLWLMLRREGASPRARFTHLDVDGVWNTYLPEGWGGRAEHPRLDLSHPFGYQNDVPGAYPWRRRP